MIPEKREKALNRLAAMAHAVLFFLGKLGRGLSFLRKEEVRVIAKTVLTPGRIHNFAVPVTGRHQRIRIVCRLNSDQNADIVSLAVCFALKPADEKLVIAGIAFRQTGKAGGMNAGGSPRASTQIPESSAIAGSPV